MVQSVCHMYTAKKRFVLMCTRCTEHLITVYSHPFISVKTIKSQFPSVFCLWGIDNVYSSSSE